jgi:nucleotide-binding universal stress UspA family protein
MNEILVAVDFSDSSINALEHAIGVAKRFKASILMVWVGNKRSMVYLGVKNLDEAITIATQKLEELVEKYKPELGEQDMEYRIRKGITYKEIVALSKENQVDMIVTGVHGVHGFRRFFMGDNAKHILAEAKVPVLTIGLHRTLDRPLEVIVMPIDSTLDTRQKVGITTRFAQVFGATIHILGIDSSGVHTIKMRVKSYVEQVAKHLDKSGVKYVTHYVKKNDARTILNYAKKVDANLIVTMMETETRASDLWLGPQAQQLVNQSPIPVLSIANRQLIKARPGL